MEIDHDRVHAAIRGFPRREILGIDGWILDADRAVVTLFLKADAKPLGYGVLIALARAVEPLAVTVQRRDATPSRRASSS